ncbi:13296_t:CDS:2 [Funneliformis mosseae]|uniref:13296_t:CDS:1 n=1 Tax=Funneliformis mosseae TaxID=27381 RepID=A0A9N9EEJ7_FUNMO|nr:13296_t:CDS:2 [Funneliformis mosseae]
MEDNWSADKQKEHGTYTKTLGKIAGSESSEYRSMAVSALKNFPQDVEKLNRRNKINNSKEKYLDLSKNLSMKSKSAGSEIPTRYDRNKSNQGQNIVFDSGHDEQKQTMRGDTLPDGDETGDWIPSNEANDYSDDDEEALPPEDSLSFALSNSKVWTLPSGKTSAILRYGASRIIDLSAHMKKWSCENDKKFIKKDYEALLRVPEMIGEENLFVLKVEDYLQKQRSRRYLDFTTKGAHTEVDVILKACAYIVEGLNKSLTIYPRWQCWPTGPNWTNWTYKTGPLDL